MDVEVLNRLDFNIQYNQDNSDQRLSIKRTKGFFKCGRPHFLVQKNLQVFRNLWCACMDKGERGG